ncbi:AP2 domain-containing protein [Xanthomonas campestris pv. raphani]|uniref:AP2 domain-containing protein n=1 Tax=Xanthomonas campestris TaxID=339 RepID=UPI00236773DF|nr:AP2 domain-containing protein [Xanthomonas campestris]MEA9822356.1 AP2 domain-containing protein [Xanthomonas campestris pv. raphani]MEA9850911.1 AP2 domain-containing protein [Xanthomonas campestris pv. raphani]MEA9855084.1 AP2 domain-containing protein [Xanthomonas campestris pv. raphani]MEA9963799.1 AP2 domain-containing protein [Xanthomonas campestris pv. raphani]WDJ20469.1 AP2 domain-containing protein [Xanthomonas campestris pv. raphani]
MVFGIISAPLRNRDVEQRIGEGAKNHPFVQRDAWLGLNAQTKRYGISMRTVNSVPSAWRVSIRRRGSVIGRQFSAKAFGSMEEALKAALAFRDEVNERFPPLTKQEAHAIRRSTNTSGVPGVFRTKMGEWKASIHFEDGTCKTRQFAVRVYGEEKARQLAIGARVELLKQVHGYVIYHDEKLDLRSSSGNDEPAVCIIPNKQEPAPNPYRLQTDRVPGVGTVNVKTVLRNGQVRRVTYRVAQFTKPEGLPKRRYFSVLRYGEKEAERLAIAQRQAWEREAHDALGR